MKKTIFTFVMVIIFNSGNYASNLSCSKKLPTFDSLEVILSLKKNNDFNYTSVLAALKGMPGLNYTAYCSNHAVYLFYIDKTIYPTQELFYEVLVKQYDLQSITELKNGSIKDILKFCSFVNNTDAANYKLTQ